jgi:glutaminyl-peptide cyclotransferase
MNLSWRVGDLRRVGEWASGRVGDIVAAASSVFFVFALVLSFVAGCKRSGGSDAQTASAATTNGATSSPNKVETPPFDANAAHELIKVQVAFGPRVPGTPGHAKQLAWMENYLRGRADTVITQSFDHTTKEGRKLRLANVFARFKPNAKDRILLVAHWDTRPTADQEQDSALQKRPILGANDGGSGVAVLMQLANILKSKAPPIGVDILLVDGEDFTNDMYLGSEFFAANMPPGYAPLYGVLIDMVGDENPHYPFESYSQQNAPEIVERVWRTAEELGYAQYFPRTDGGAISDDHLPLQKAGIHTIDIIDFDYGPSNAYWHTLKDTVEHTSPTGLGVIGNVLAQLIYREG